MFNRFRVVFIMSGLALLAAPNLTFGQFPQGFDGGAGLPTDWVSLNVSPGGPGANPNWAQTNAGVFPSHGGSGFVFANYQSSLAANPISNYLMSPVVTLENGTTIRFWTRTVTSSGFPDRLILTYSTNGASTDPTDFGNIANVSFHNLVDINPNLELGGYPDIWTQFTATMSGLAGPTQGRIAFWYYVQTDAGPLGANSNYLGVDDVELVPPGVTTGACCDGAGGCALSAPAACTAPGNTFFGIGSLCGAVSCVGKCCQPDGFCAVLAPNACSGAGFAFGGLGTQCGPIDECLGKCCYPDGSCLADGPAPCVASGGTFGGVGVACGDGSSCRGRCCVGNACTPNSSPTSCAQAGGTLTLGADCLSTTDHTFTTALAIPDGLGGVPPNGGLGAQVTNVQNVAGVTGNITDLNVDVKIDHTFVGDLIVAVEHLGTTVIVVDLMGHAAFDCLGCAQNNIDVILDDEGTGGAIEDQCNTTAPAAVSPPKFVPANPLAAFDGMSPNGAWTIKLQDACGGDTGTLVRWSLHFGNPATNPCVPSCACKGDLNGSGTVNGADINKFAQCVASAGGAGCACADINGGGITAADVTPFVSALIAGTACIP